MFSQVDLSQNEEVLLWRSYSKNSDFTISHGTPAWVLSDWMTIVRKNHEHREARDLNGIDNARKKLLKFRADVRLCDVDRQFYIDYIDWLRSFCNTAWSLP